MSTVPFSFFLQASCFRTAVRERSLHRGGKWERRSSTCRHVKPNGRVQRSRPRARRPRGRRRRARRGSGSARIGRPAAYSRPGRACGLPAGVCLGMPAGSLIPRARCRRCSAALPQGLQQAVSDDVSGDSSGGGGGTTGAPHTGAVSPVQPCWGGIAERSGC